jgi:hypothetical protein
MQTQIKDKSRMGREGGSGEVDLETGSDGIRRRRTTPSAEGTMRVSVAIRSGDKNHVAATSR